MKEKLEKLSKRTFAILYLIEDKLDVSNEKLKETNLRKYILDLGNDILKLEKGDE